NVPMIVGRVGIITEEGHRNHGTTGTYEARGRDPGRRRGQERTLPGTGRRRCAPALVGARHRLAGQWLSATAGGSRTLQSGHGTQAGGSAAGRASHRRAERQGARGEPAERAADLRVSVMCGEGPPLPRRERRALGRTSRQARVHHTVVSASTFASSPVSATSALLMSTR